MSTIDDKNNKSEAHVEMMMKKRNFYQDFRDLKSNYLLMITGFLLIVLILVKEIFYNPWYQRPRYSLALYVLNFIFLIIIQSDWQRYKRDYSIIEALFIFWFSLIGALILFEYGWFLATICSILLILQIRYFVNRENRIATRINILEEDLENKAREGENSEKIKS